MHVRAFSTALVVALAAGDTGVIALPTNPTSRTAGAIEPRGFWNKPKPEQTQTDLEAGRQDAEESQRLTANASPITGTEASSSRQASAHASQQTDNPNGNQRHQAGPAPYVGPGSDESRLAHWCKENPKEALTVAACAAVITGGTALATGVIG